MYRILIVDDEKIERRGIRFLLTQMKVDCEIAEAVNGKAALEYLGEHPVDLLLTDVRMPFMDGLELIEQAENRKKELRFVIFSGCNEFEYAKKAVRLGVSDYILKPVDPVEFERTITKVLRELDEAKRQKDMNDKTLSWLGEHLLYRVVNGADPDELEEYRRGFLPKPFLVPYKRMMLLEFTGDFFGKNGVDFQTEILKQEPCISHYLNLDPSRSLLFFREEENDIYDMAEKICAWVQEHYGESCFAAVSSCIAGDDDRSRAAGIYKAAEELGMLMEGRFYHPACHVFYTGMKQDSDALIGIDDDTLMKQMKQDLKRKDIAELRIHFEHFCRNYSGRTNYSQIYVKFLFSNLLKAFYDNLPDAEEADLDHEIDTLFKAADFSAVKALLNRNIDRLERIFAKSPAAVHREVETVIRYIYAHYGDELGVEQLAEMVYMAPSYLSSVFKKETGQNLSKFIKAYRMEQAKDMLENTMAKIGDISVRCGYANVSYFCSSFREYYGISPQRFREGEEALS